MTVAAFIIILFGLAVVGFLLYRLADEFRRARSEKADDKTVLMLQQQLDQLRKTFQDGLKDQNRTVNEQMKQSNEVLQKQFRESAKIIKDVTEKLTKLDETNKQVVGFAEQMKSLENILLNPKQRGILGEFFLEQLLSNVLPPTGFKMQYSFESGETVDAAIFVQDKVIPVDAKFSLENYNKIMEEGSASAREKLEREFKVDLKKRIDETSKYVRPDEGTTDFAFMFIPADGVFYNLLVPRVGAVEVNTQDLISYAFSRRVIMVSPMTFYAYLQTILHALKALKIEESAREIQKRVGDLSRHMNAYEDYMLKLGTHLGTTVNTYNSAGKEFMKIDKDVVRITEGASGGDIDVPLIDRPKGFADEEVKVTLKEAKIKANT